MRFGLINVESAKKGCGTGLSSTVGPDGRDGFGLTRAVWDTTGQAGMQGQAWLHGQAWLQEQAGLHGQEQAPGAGCSTRGARECEAWTAAVVPWTSPRVVTAVVPMVEPRGSGAISPRATFNLVDRRGPTS